MAFKIADLFVSITADTSQIDAALNKLPSTATSKIQKMKAQLARNKLDLKSILVGEGGGYRLFDEVEADMQRLGDSSAELARKIGLIEGTAKKQAEALRRSAEATRQLGSVSVGAANGMGQVGVAAMSQSAALGQASSVSQQLGGTTRNLTRELEEAKKAATRKTIALLAVSSAIEDMQYGFRGVVNNLPMMASLFTDNADKAMKLGGAFQLAGVAINTWVNNFKDAVEIAKTMVPEGFDLTSTLTRISNAFLTASASVSEFVLSAGRIAGVSLTVADLAAQQKQVEMNAERAKEGERGLKAISEIGTEGAEKRAASFEEAVKKAGGGEMVRRSIEDIIKRRGGTEETQKRGLENLGINFTAALKGNESAIRNLTTGLLSFKPLAKAYAEVSPEAKAREKAAKEEEQERKNEQEKTARMIEADNRKLEAEREKEGHRVAHAMEMAAEKELLTGKRFSLEDMMRSRMEKAGFKPGEAFDDIANKAVDTINKTFKEKVQSMVLERGITPKEAMAELEKDRAQKETLDRLAKDRKKNKELGKENEKASQAFELAEYARKLRISQLSAAMGKEKDNIGQKQIGVLEKIRQSIEKSNEKMDRFLRQNMAAVMS